MVKRPLSQPLPCPFCGELPEIQPWHGGRKEKRMVSCFNDKCAPGPAVTGPSRAVAIRLWNERVPPC